MVTLLLLMLVPIAGSFAAWRCTSADGANIPATETVQAINLAFAADVGALGAEHTLTGMVSDGVSAIFLAGDLSYGDIRPEEAWCDWVKVHVGETFPVQVLVGDHEHDHAPDGHGHIREFATCLPDRLNSTDGPGGYGVNYYTDLEPGVRVISIAPGLDVEGERYRFGSASLERAWLEGVIADARTLGYWVIVQQHGPCITIGKKTCGIGQSFVSWLIGATDLVVSGDDHNYQRTHQLNCMVSNTVDYSCIVDVDSSHRQGLGGVWVIAGTVGRELYACSEDDPEYDYFAAYWCAEQGIDTRGYLHVSLSENRLRGEFRTHLGPEFADSFVITR